MPTLPILLSPGGVIEFEEVPTGNRLMLRLLSLDNGIALIEVGGDTRAYSIVRLESPPAASVAVVASETAQP